MTGFEKLIITQQNGKTTLAKTTLLSNPIMVTEILFYYLKQKFINSMYISIVFFVHL